VAVHLPSPSSSRLKIGALCLAVCIIALLPWCRNHDYLRDFYDYGLFINVNARLAEGQLPYADFTTPAQTAAFFLNYAAEFIGGGTYLGLTHGAAALIVVTGLALLLMLARRCPPWIAALLALAVTVGSASQHTIIFYNPIGVLALALVIWSFALAPLLRRETWGWHLLAAIGLLLGGINKINFHLLACAMAFGWLIHAWAVEKPARSRVALTAAFIGLFGFVLPIGLEIIWTGAGWRAWFYNVVTLPLSARGGRISLLFSPDLYLKTLHGYYGTLRVPQVGLLGVLMPLIAIVAAIRGAAAIGSNRGRLMLQVLAGLLAAFASSALLLTNNEIAYVTFAAALVIAISLWLGFKLEPHGGWFVGGVILPAIILAAAGWESAWDGQRSQFGHDGTPRAQYTLGEQAGVEFTYLHGLHVPPALANSMAALTNWRSQLRSDEAKRIFYGPGVEWLEHVWPAPQVRGLPLVAAAFDGDRENDLLKHEVIGSDRFQHLVVLEAWDHWSDPVRAQIDQTTFSQRIGTSLIVYSKFKPGTVSSRPLEFSDGGLNSNVDGSRITTSMPMQELADTRRYLGIDHGEGRIDLDAPSHRMRAEYVLTRASPGQAGSHTAQMAIYANMSGGLLPRWSKTVTLPDGQDELVLPTEPIDSSGLPSTLTVSIPNVSAGLVRAGWRAMQFTDTAERNEAPPILQPAVEHLAPMANESRFAFLADQLPNAAIFTRKATFDDGAFLLRAGGEVWVKLDGLYSNIKILAKLRHPQAGTTPLVRIVYYKSGRIESFAPTLNATDGTAHFTAWSPELGGWLGILAHYQADTPPMQVKIESISR